MGFHKMIVGGSDVELPLKARFFLEKAFVFRARRFEYWRRVRLFLSMKAVLMCLLMGDSFRIRSISSASPKITWVVTSTTRPFSRFFTTWA